MHFTYDVRSAKEADVKSVPTAHLPQPARWQNYDPPSACLPFISQRGPMYASYASWRRKHTKGGSLIVEKAVLETLTHEFARVGS